jgi:hypothetical protein
VLRAFEKKGNYNRRMRQRHKVAVIEYEGDVPSKIDPRLKCCKKIIVLHRDVRHVELHTVLGNALELMKKLERLWPCHPLAKEYPDG